MKFLDSAEAISREFERMLRQHTSFSAAVAWASVEFPALDALLEHRDKIHQMVVGLHFYQTHPEFLRAFRGDDRVRVTLDSRGVFHPKIYLFSSQSGAWDCIVGSANFTRGGFGSNTEAALMVSSSDEGSASVKRDVEAFIEMAWADNTQQMSDEAFAAYEVKWASKPREYSEPRSRPSGAKNRKNTKHRDEGRDVTATPILMKTWDQYFSEIINDQIFPNQVRLKALASIRSWFRQYPHFSSMPINIRKRISGCTVDSDRLEIDWHMFGSMAGAGYFKEAVGALNSPQISEALDQIPLVGPIQKTHFDGFVKHFNATFEGKRGGGPFAVASASRLLAMKRPDYFVCVDSKNRRTLCKASDLVQNVDFDMYWEALCGRLYQSAWWNSPEPTEALALDVWKGRAALLDVLFYEPN